MIVIYEADCPEHLEVVRQLTRVLRSHCLFDVVSEMTRETEIRHSKTDFVLDSFRRADVVLTVVSERLRSAWLERRRDHRTTPDNRLRSVGELLLQQLREDYVLRPRGVKLRVAARFDYTPARTDVDTDLALVSEVYELMDDIYRLLFVLRGVNRRTQALSLACCLPPVSDDITMSRLTESVVVARQRYQQVRVNAGASNGLAAERDDISLSIDETEPFNAATSFDTLYISQRVSQLNEEYDNELAQSQLVSRAPAFSRSCSVIMP